MVPDTSYETSLEDLVGFAKKIRIRHAGLDPASRISWNNWIPATGLGPAQAPPERRFKEILAFYHIVKFLSRSDWPFLWPEAMLTPDTCFSTLNLEPISSGLKKK